MKKKITMLVIAIIIVLGTIIAITQNKTKKYLDIDGMKFAILVNGTAASAFPSGKYKADVSCTNATGYWDAVLKKVIVKNITGNVSCDVSFTSITNNDYFNTYIIGLNNTTQGTGKLVHETFVDESSNTIDTGYRYEGKNPNNYVLFNNELWRIIGVFDSNTHGVSGKNLVKLIRPESIGNLIWNKDEVNDWSVSNLYKLLNGAYYNHTVDNTNCYISNSLAYVCDYTTMGIQSSYQGMIQNSTWYLGSGGKEGFTTKTANAYYLYERNASLVYSSGTVTRPSKVTNKIGLMYVSDYSYGPLASSCARTTNFTNYVSNGCAGNNWLISSDEWLINPSSSDGTKAFITYGSGRIPGGLSTTTLGIGIRPVLYLTSTVYRVSGTGSAVDPYIIGIS